MNLIKLLEKYPTQQACIEHLETARWGDNPACPFCKSKDVARKHEGVRVGRWNCHACKSSFNVLSGTVMRKTRIPLQKWFLGIALMVNAKKSLSSYPLARDLDVSHQSALAMQWRIRVATASKQRTLLRGIIEEADETDLGGKPRKGNKREDDKPAPKGRGTNKRRTVGAVERGGRVTARTAAGVGGKTLLKFIKDTVDLKDSTWMTDAWKGDKSLKGFMPHEVVNHSISYADGGTFTPTRLRASGRC